MDISPERFALIALELLALFQEKFLESFEIPFVQSNPLLLAISLEQLELLARFGGSVRIRIFGEYAFKSLARGGVVRRTEAE